MARSARLLLAGLVLATACAPGTWAAGAAWRPPLSLADAEQMRRLDLMLMVTGLQCRASADDFRADLRRMDQLHQLDLGQATARLRAGLARRYGQGEAARQLDHMSVEMANAYGRGHPWLSCGDLRDSVRALSHRPGRQALLAAASTMLGGGTGRSDDGTAPDQPG